MPPCPPPIGTYGSLDVNGTPRELFKECEYVGVDIRPGDGVDHVMTGAQSGFLDDAFHVVLYLETMEHDRTFWLTLDEIK